MKFIKTLMKFKQHVDLTHPIIPSLKKRGEDPYLHERKWIIEYNGGFPSPVHGRGDMG
jgi:hypothetical protein